MNFLNNKRGQLAIIVVVLIVIAAAAYYFTAFNKNSGDSAQNLPSTNSNANANPSTETQNNSQTTATSAQTSPQQYSISIKSFAFSPAALNIKAGDTVVWTNEDSVAHTVTSDSGSELDSQYLSRGQSYSHTFSAAGTFAYHCTPHPGMKGTIVVQ